MKEILCDYEEIIGNIYTREKYLKDIITALALCHNVTPVYSGIESILSKEEEIPRNRKSKNFSNINEKAIKDFQASSPD